jgi:hypothetical protein
MYEERYPGSMDGWMNKEIDKLMDRLLRTPDSSLMSDSLEGIL